MSLHRPLRIELHTKSKELELFYEEGSYRLTAELLRVMSPSAEVQGHTEDQAVLQTGKRNVAISAVEPVGHYAVKLVFDDGHDSGLFTWDYLFELAANKQYYWQEYIEKLRVQGGSRDVDTTSKGQGGVQQHGHGMGDDPNIIATSGGCSTRTRH